MVDDVVKMLLKVWNTIKVIEPPILFGLMMVIYIMMEVILAWHAS